MSSESYKSVHQACPKATPDSLAKQAVPIDCEPESPTSLPYPLLPEIGIVYFEQCCEMLDRLDEVEATVSRAAVFPSGVLKMSAPVWFANRIFTKMLAAYQTQFPEVTLEIDLSGRMVNLVEDGFDLALRVTRQVPVGNLIARPIAPIQFRLVAAQSYLAKAGHAATPEAVAQHPMMTYSLQLGSEVTLEGPTESDRVTFKPLSVLRTNNEILIHDAAMDGMGIAFLPTWLVDDDLAAGALEPVLPQYHLPFGTLYAVYTSRRCLSSKVRSFVDFLTDRFASTLQERQLRS